MSVQTAPREMPPGTSHTASHPAPAPTDSHGLNKGQQEGVNSLCHSLAPTAVPPQRAGKGQQGRNRAGGLCIDTSPLKHRKTNKSTKPKAAPTPSAVNLPNGRDSSRKTIFPSARQLLCSFNYPREFTDGFLPGSLFISHIFCLFPKTDLITLTCTGPALTHW